MFDLNIIELDATYYKKYLLLMNEFRPVDVNMTQEQFNTIYNKIKQTGQIYIYVKDNVIMGSITILIEQKFIYNGCKVAHIEDLYVANNMRGRGIGTILIEFSQLYCKTEQCYKIVLYCDEKLVDFYKNFRFDRYAIQMKYNISL
jgi:glucosamine-phosphate N-acetyltransferase